MTKEEFENWYNNKQDWLKYKSRYLLSTIGWSFSDMDELISLTIEDLLTKLESINLSTVDSWVFFKMKDNMRNKLTYHTRKSCCEGDFSVYNIQSEEYDVESDNKYEKMSEILDTRAENEEQRLVLTTLKEGKKLNTLGWYKGKTTNILKKLKGEEPYKRKSRAKGIAKGRPKLNKIKSKNMRVYKGVVRLNDNKIIKVYPSANDVIRDGFSRESVSKCCNGKLKSHKGYTWKFVKDEKENKEEK